MEPLVKLCRDCGETKSINDFHKHSQTKDGRNTFCKPCANRRSRENHHANKASRNSKRRELYLKTVPAKKAEAVAYKGGKCENCGGEFLPCQFDFHHLDPLEKEFNPSQAIQQSKGVMYKELDKCVLLCANCHRLAHFAPEGFDLGKEV